MKFCLTVDTVTLSSADLKGHHIFRAIGENILRSDKARSCQGNDSDRQDTRTQ